jgi:aminobenzoyl-glutamate utilization protein A
MTIKDISDEINDEILSLRRDFHKYPELAFTEFRTASLIARKLKDIGCDIKIGREIFDVQSRMALPAADILEREFKRAAAQGGDAEFLNKVKGGFPAVAAVISNGKGPVIALRVDIDALPVQESSDKKHFPFKKGFASVNAGVMHACGHDAHAVTGLGVAKVLMKLKGKIRGTVKIIFQPAEETICGAYPIVKSGFLDDVDRIMAIHYYSPWDAGLVSCTRGLNGHLAISRFDARFRGRQSHAGSRPEEGKNALMAAANAVLNLNAIPRHSKGATRINIGKLNAGTARNVTCDEAFMELETRGATTELNEYMRENTMRILKASAELWDCKLEVTPMGSAPGGSSDNDFADEIMSYAKKAKTVTVSEKQRNCGSEDFICMLEHVRKRGGKGAVISIGAGPSGPHHSSEFDMNEAVIKDSIVFISGFIFECLQK